MYRIKYFTFYIVLTLSFLLTSSAIAGSWATVGSLDTARVGHSATLLQNGKILFAGASNVGAELYDPATNKVSIVGQLNTNRSRHTATLLPNGKVLVTGGNGEGGIISAELYDQDTGTWTNTGSMQKGRWKHTATLLNNGRVLIAGGYGNAPISSAEIYDPAEGTWSNTGSMAIARGGHTATLLTDGRVLVAGGYGDSSAEIYNPSTGEWDSAGNMKDARQGHTATLLPNGNVLVVGGSPNIAALNSAEIFNSSTGWEYTGYTSVAREQHSATLLPNGKVFVVGGNQQSPTGLTSTEVYDPDSSNGTWSNAESMQTDRLDHTATLLPSGKVIVTGGWGGETIEEYNYSASTWTNAGVMNSARYGHTSTLLPEGKVLVAGGEDTYAPEALAAEIYNPATNIWANTGSMASSRIEHTATLLQNGNVLMTGGYYKEVIDYPDGDFSIVERFIETTEIFNPSQDEFSIADSLNTTRQWHTATLLPDGKVLVAGGEQNHNDQLDSVEVYDPAANTWTLLNSMHLERARHTATLLQDGRVLVAGGEGASGTLKSAEIYDPTTNTWTFLDNNMNVKRYRHTATLLPNGRVLVTGGWNDSSAEIYDPKFDLWTNTNPMNALHSDHAATLLRDGRVLITGSTPEIYSFTTDTWTSSIDLIAGGQTATLLPDDGVLITYSDDAEIFDRGLGIDPAWRPIVTMGTSLVEVGNDGLLVSGSGFIGVSEAASGNGAQNSPTNYPLAQLLRIDSGQSIWLQHDPTKSFSDTRFDSLPVLNFPGGHAQLTVFTNGIPSVSKIVLVNSPPTVNSIVRVGPNPVNVSSVDFSVTFSEYVYGVDTGDFSLNGSIAGGAITSVSGSGNSYTVTVSGYSGIGSLRLDVVDDDTIVDFVGTPLGGTGAGNGDYTSGDVYDIDMIAPFLANVTVQLDGSSVDVIFTETMGHGATTTTNYILSGNGQGTLSENPDSVSPQSGSIYRLIWDTGEMSNDSDVTITISNVQDLVGNLIGLPNSATDIGGGIGTSPITNAAPASVPEGFDNIQEVTLTCNDNDGSGCSATYFSMDGSDPSIIYTDPISINEDTQLKFYSVDQAGNQESIQTEVYYINIPTAITCELQPEGIIFGESFEVSGQITPAPYEAGQGIAVRFVHADGGSFNLTTHTKIDGSYTLDDVSCDDLTQAGDDWTTSNLELVGNWDVQASWIGDDGHIGSTSPSATLSVSQATTSLTLDVVASEAIKVNSRPPIGGDFSPAPLCSGMDLSGIGITLYATEPDRATVHELNASTNQYGQFLLDFDTAEAGQPFAFDLVGEWTISAAFVGSTEFASSDTDNVIIRVVPTAGYAIVVQGRVQSGEGMPSHHKTTTFVYDKLKDRQLLDDDIQYLSWLYSDGWDGDPSKTNIQDALTIWARDKMDPDFAHPVAELDTQGQAGDLYIVLIDHGWTDPLDDEEGIFYIYPDSPLTSTELGGWLSELQTNLAGTVSEDRNIVVVLGFCRAAAFMEDLSDPAYENRIVIASAAKDESSHRGPQDVDENGQPLRDGEYFVSEFFKSVSYGKSIKQCFEDATLLTESFTSSGSGVTNAPFYDDSIQHPLLNDNGDAIGSNELSSVAGEDGAISEFLYIGASPPEGNDPGDVLITQVNSAQFLGISDSQVNLWAEVDDPNDLRLIWLEIKEPNYNPVDPGAELQIEMNNFKKATTDVTGTRYTWSSVGDSPDPVDLFDIPGTYQVFYFSKDNDTGHVSPLIQSRIYKALDGNTQPNTFSLLTPADQASVLTSTILDWEDATDPEEDNLSYTILLSEDDDQFTDPIRIEGLTNSAYLLSPDDGIQDLSTYYWKVLAIDTYGAIRESDTRVFDTDDTNPAFGWIMGYVTNTLNDEPVAYATVQFDVLTLSTDASGYYIGVRPPGNYSLKVTALGFTTFGPETVVITEGGALEKNITMTPSEANTSPIATIELPASHISILVGGVVNFQGTITSGDAPYTYAWDFNGGATNSSQQDPGDVIFSTEGAYDVTFTVTDDDGDTDSDGVTIIVTLTDECLDDPYKTVPGICGCGVPDTDTDDDTILDCDDTDDDNDGILDENDDFPLDDTETLDTDEDGTGNNADIDDDNDGISDAIESAGPNAGDANGDGTQDSLQNNVVCLISYTAQGYVILETPDGIVLSDCQTAENPSPPDTPSDMVFYYGFFDFTISGIALGGSTTLTMTLPTGIAAPITYYKYGQTQADPTDHWYEFLYDGQTGAEINGNVVTLHFSDALRGDDVLTEDSIVVDLGAPGFDSADVDFEPTATITSPATNMTIDVGDSVNFQGSVTSGNLPFTYSWNFGGGATNVNSEDPGNVIFSTIGTYTVTFTVTDVDNDTDSDTVTITVNALDAPGDDGGGGGGGGGGSGGGCFIDSLRY